jgi:thiol-disulfide isomerase/thioredoxin
MKRKILKTVIIGVISLSILYLGFKIYQRLEAKKEIEATVKIFQDFCAFDLKYMNELHTGSLSEKPVILLFIHPECEFCNEEIKQIKKQETQLEDVVILLITHAEKEQALEFYSSYSLSQFDNIHLLIDDYLKVAGLYGSPPVPSVFLYRADKKLLFKHNGAIKIDAILKNIPK